MHPVKKWAIIGAALAFVQYFIFNGASQGSTANRIALGVLGILMYSGLGVIVGLVINYIHKKQ